MKRHIPGLHTEPRTGDSIVEGVFLVRVEQVFYRWHPLRAFYVIRFAINEPQLFARRCFSTRLYCSQRALWKLNWFLRDFGYDADLLGREEVDEKALVGLQGILRVSRTALNGRTYVNVDGFAPASEWDELFPTVPAAQRGAL